MTAHAPLVLFYGETTTAVALQHALNSRSVVYHPQRVMEALGMYISYMPDVIVIDSCAQDAAAVLLHLQSVDAQAILLLTDETRAAYGRGVTALPRNVGADALALAVYAAARGESPTWAARGLNGLNGGLQRQAFRRISSAEVLTLEGSD